MTPRPRRFRVVLTRCLAVLGLAASCLLLTSGTAQAFPGIDCHGDAPLPASPYGFGVKPRVVNVGKDPFHDPGVSLESVYGTSPQWWTYDNGCSPTAKIMPGLGAGLGNIGLQIDGVLPNWSHSLMDAVVAPSGWLGPLDKPVAAATRAVSHGVWSPWLGLVLTLVAILVLWRARQGHLGAGITAVVWALLVLVGVSALISYPTASVKTVDGAVRTAVVGIASGFNGSSVGIGDRAVSQRAALRSVDGQMDAVNRDTQYRAWLKGVFGDPGSTTARHFGPRVFKATHFSWREYATYIHDPTGRGKQIREAKQHDFENLADQIKNRDPVAYDYFTGNHWSDRIGIIALNTIVVLSVCLFLFVAGLCVLLSFALIRMFVPIAPALGVIFMVDSTRDQALSLLRRVFGPLVMGPAYFLASLVLLRFEAAILGASMPFPLQVAFVIGLSLLAWRMLRPASNLVRVRVPGLRTLATYVAARKGTHDGVEEAEESNEGSKHGSQARAEAGYEPVHHVGPQRTAIPSGATPTPAGALPASTPGTFVSRPSATGEPGSGRQTTAMPLSASTAADDRALPPGPTGADEVSAETSNSSSAGLLGRPPIPLASGPTEPTEQLDSATDHAGGQVETNQATAESPVTRDTSQDVATGTEHTSYRDEHSLEDVHEANLVYDDEGNRVFVVYSPRTQNQADRAE